jgi:hypothetical protein
VLIKSRRILAAVLKMKKIIYTLLPLIFLFTSCEKDKKKYVVSYKVIMISGNPKYSVSYSSFNNATQSSGPITQNTWTSPAIDDREEGNPVSLTLQGGGGGAYLMNIYVDGSLAKQERMDDPFGPKTITVDLD